MKNLVRLGLIKHKPKCFRNARCKYAYGACANFIKKNKHGGEICQDDRGRPKTRAYEVFCCFRGGENCPKLYSKVFPLHILARY